MKYLVFFAVLFYSAFFSFAPAAAQSRPCLELRFEGEWASRDQEVIAQELAAAIQLRDFDLCPEISVGRDVPARIDAIRRRGTATLRVTHYETQRALERDLDLEAFHSSGVLFAVAIAIDELLRASWAELLFVEEAPVREVRSVDFTAPQAPPQGAWLGVEGNTEGFTGGQVLLGAGLFTDIDMHPRVRLRVSAGLRAALPEQSSLGTIHTWGFVASLDAAFRLVGTGRASHLVLRVGTYLGWLRYTADPIGGAEASSASSLLSTAWLGLGWVHRWSRSQLGLDVGAGPTLYAPVARVDGDVATGTQGAMLFVRLHVGFRP